MRARRSREPTARLLLRLGVLLFLLGLVLGFAVPAMTNPRIVRSSHLEGIVNGLFLVALGLMWPRLDLSRLWLGVTFWLALFGTYGKLVATFLASAWGAGARTMPIAAHDHMGTQAQGMVVRAILVALSLAMVGAVLLVFIGLLGPGPGASSSPDGDAVAS